MKFSVIVVTYNSDWDKIRRTLASIVEQRFADFEIVISDDGSKENYFTEIEDFFREKHFDRYTLIPHEKNQGTVKNLIDALEASKGDYVRDFGAGDTFYSVETLSHLSDFMDTTQTDICFGLMQGFYYENQELVKTSFCHPFDIEVYRKMQSASGKKATHYRNRMLKNLILYSDNPSGAAMCYKREIYLSYLKRISPIVKYQEDIFPVLAALEGKDISLFDEYMVWYESNSGVSTKKKSKFSELLRQDVDRFYEMLYETFPEDENVIKRKRVAKFYKIRNLYVRTLFRLFVNPDALRYLMLSFIQRKTGKHRMKQEFPGNAPEF